MIKKTVRFILMLALVCNGQLFLPRVWAETSNPAQLQEVLIHKDALQIKLDKSVSYRIFKVNSPSKMLVLELNNTQDSWSKKSIDLKRNLFLTRVRSGQFALQPAPVVRLVMELKDEAAFESKDQSDPNGFLISIILRAADVAAVDAAAVPPAKTQDQPLAEDQNKTENKEDQKKVLTPAGAANTKTQSAPSVAAIVPSALFGRKPISLDFYEIDVRDLFKILGEKADLNIVFGRQVSGQTSVQLRQVPFQDAVETILVLTQLHMVSLGGNIIQILTEKEFDEYKTRAISMTSVIALNYAKADEVNTQLVSILNTLGGKGKTMVDARTNSIIVTDTPEGIAQIRHLITDLDKPTQQVMIEAKIVQISLGKNVDLGIAWGSAYTDNSGGQIVTIGASKALTDASAALPGANGALGRTAVVPGGGTVEGSGAGFSPATGLGLAFGFVKDSVRLNATLSALQQDNKSRLLSNPKVATLNNQAATIKSQVSEPYITKEVSFSQGQSVTAEKVNTTLSGISLTVTPTINADGRITMKIIPDVTSSQPTSIGVPKTTSQQADTTVIVRDGETFVIGGLISEVESDSQSSVPFLSKIPLLGYLFRSKSDAKSRAELLVFVTPRIIPL